MKAKDFRDYQTTAKTLNVRQSPFSKIVAVRFAKGHKVISASFKLSHGVPFDESFILNSARSLRQGPDMELLFAPSKTVQCSRAIPKDKENDLRKMMKFIPQADVEFYNTLF